MYLPNAAGQSGVHRAFRADGSLTSSVLPQLILPQALSRCQLMIMNTSAAGMFMEHGPPRANATITAGVVTAVTVLNGGFNFTLPPTVQFLGGAGQGTGVLQGYADFIANSSWNGRGLIGSVSPTGTSAVTARPAVARAVLTANAVTSIVIDDGGAGYINPPEVLLINDPRDPFGCANPATGGGSGLILAPSGGSYYLNHTAMWTDAIALFGTAGSTFFCEYMI